MEIREARSDPGSADVARITGIYAHHVRHGTATFDIEPPDEGFIAHKLTALQQRGCPFLVATVNGLVIGYAYAAPFRDRAAYAGTCEDSIYIDPDHVGRGVGKALLAAAIEAAAAKGFVQMIAVIGGGEPASVALHKGLGFHHAGRLEAVGYKFGRWLDIVMMQRALSPS
jgi:phosphinothricin acetyltransferase